MSYSAQAIGGSGPAPDKDITMEKYGASDGN